MPSDWLFYWMTLPGGLTAIALAIGLPFALWAALLGKARNVVGYSPLALAYLLAAVGLLLLNFGSSYIEFSARVSNNVLSEQQRWPTVSGCTVYTFVLSLVVALPLLGFLAVPMAALLLRVRHFSVTVIACSLVAFWLALSGLVWAFLINDWERTHRLESLLSYLSSFGLPIAFVGVPFLGGIYVRARKFHSEA